MSEDRDDLDNITRDIYDMIEDARPAHIVVSKNSKGYNFSVSYRGKDANECLDKVLNIVEILKTKFEK